MDIEQTKTGVVWIVSELQDVVWIVLLGEFDGNNISVQGLDMVWIQVRVTEVRVDLSLVLNNGGSDSEGFSGPLVVLGSFFTSSQWQTFSDGWFIDLDDLNTGGFQVSDFVSDSQSQLVGLGLLVDIVSWERPSQTSDWTGQHTLNWLLSNRLGVDNFLNGHWLWSGQVTDDDWWSNVTGTVRLDPTVDSESVTFQLFTEELNHIVSFWFTVDQDVQTDFFLESDDSFDFFIDELFVFFTSDGTLVELVSVDSDVLGLRERTDGSSWEQI